MNKKSNQAGLSHLAQRTGPPPISWLMQLALNHPGLISLAAGFTDSESLPVDTAGELLAGLLRSRRTGLLALQYGSPLGDPDLRRLTARHLRRLDRAAASSRSHSAARMIITNGSQQLLYMTMEALCNPGDTVLVEDPTYFVFLGIVQSHGLRARSVRMERDGLSLAQLEKVLEGLKKSGGLRRLKALYLVSYFQNPTGITTSFEKKKRALALLRKYESAAGHPLYLMEDAAYRELRFKGRDVASALTAPGGADRVIYAGTYSKPFATGARVGFGILPEPLFTAVSRIKGNHDFGTSNLLQQLLAQALASGRYETHLHRLRRRYAQKVGVMLKALRERFPPEIQWQEPEGGLYFWARLPRGTKSGPKSGLFRTALRQNVLYVPGVLCYADDSARPKPDCEMRLSFGGASERDIREGIKRLGFVLQGGR